MPIPSPHKDEEKKKFLERCMSDEIMVKDFPDEKQRFAVCNTQWDEKKSIEPEEKEESFSINIEPIEDELTERRCHDLDEFRFDADKNEITGYAARFGVWSVDLGGFKERIKQGAFAKTIKDGDVRLLFNHDPNFILARTTNGTMSLEEDRKGLSFTASLPNTTYASDLKESIKRGDISQNSFGFRVINDKWKISDDRNELDERTLTEVKLFDVSPVTFPAYPQTTVKVRSILKEEGIDWELISKMVLKIKRGLELTDEESISIRKSIEKLLVTFPINDTKEPDIEIHSEDVVEPSRTLVLTQMRIKLLKIYMENKHKEKL